MNILYHSTRGDGARITASEAILNGIAPDGGLYVPDSVPALDVAPEKLTAMTYQETAFEVMSRFLTDFTEDELRSCISKAYATFDTPVIAPLVKKGNAWYLELFHGKTIAFKDLALSILPHLMTTAAKKRNLKEKILILTATSGDTGKAAMAGFADVPGTEIIVFYPRDGVSPVQERQMVTQKGDNTHVVAIRGNFDDAQTGVKKLFTDPSLAEELLEKGYRFSSANSINIGRLVPQIVYYVYAYASMVRQGAVSFGEPVNVTVPTGNFGNILSAYYAKQMGVPIGRLICASNKNKVLTDFFGTGRYDRNRPFYTTSSPSMDILVSSNLERLIYMLCGNDAERTAAFMKDLSSQGAYTIDEAMRAGLKDFYGGCAEEEDVMSAISALYSETGYVIDPHTAVASFVYESYRAAEQDQTPNVIASTASPFKFARSVLHAIDPAYDSQGDEEQFHTLSKVSGVAIPGAIKEILDAERRHNTTVDAEEMRNTVISILGN